MYNYYPFHVLSNPILNFDATESFMEEAKVAVSSDTKLSQDDINKVCLERAEKFLTLYNQVIHWFFF